MEWQRLVELLVAALAGGVATNLPRLLVLRRQAPAETRKLDAEADGEQADAHLALVQSYKLLVDDLRVELEIAKSGLQIRDEELRNLKKTVSMLYEQKMALAGYNTALTAKLAVVLGVDVLNGDDFEPAARGNDEPI